MYSLQQVVKPPQAPKSPVLVQCAISHRKPKLHSTEQVLEVYADMVRVRRKPAVRHTTNRPTRSAAKRGVISGFSRKSRKRMIERLAMLRTVSDGYFVTLTYPDDVSHAPTKAKRDLDTLIKRIKRRFPRAGGVWRLELKPRLSGELQGQLAPHYHVLLFGLPVRQQLFRRWLQLVWSRIVYETNKPPRNVRTRADVIHNRRHAARYASKYAAKEEPGEEPGEGLKTVTWGRRWGVFGATDFTPVLTVTTSAAQVVKLRRLIRRWLKARHSRFEQRLRRMSPHDGFTILGLGDMSLEAGLFDSTIFAMLMA